MSGLWSAAMNWASSRVPSAAEGANLAEALRAVKGRGLDTALEALWRDTSRVQSSAGHRSSNKLRESGECREYVENQ